VLAEQDDLARRGELHWGGSGYWIYGWRRDASLKP
jgi:hypothetical protein